jgi:hypothetical protein
MPVFELDTVEVPVSKVTFVSRQVQFRLGPILRSQLKGGLSFAMSLGVEYRTQGQVRDGGTLYWLGENGQFQNRKREELVMKKYVLSPYLTAGIHQSLNGGWRTGLVIATLAPGAQFNDNPEIQWSAWQLGIAVQLLREF